MEHPYYRFSLDPTQERVSMGNLKTALNNWKLTADQFYRGSEVVFNMVRMDYKIILRNHSIRQKTGKLVSRGYIPFLDHVYFLQIGVCLENMIKGVLTHQKPELVAGKKIDSFIKSHNLKNLSEKINGFQITEDEKKFFEFLTINIEWYSKYPIPVRAKNAVRSSGHRITEVRKAFLILYNKLSRMMEETGDLKEHLHGYKSSGEK